MTGIKLRQFACVVTIFYLLSLTGCAQGFEIKVGVGRYNESHEVRGYKEPVENDRK